MLRIETRLPQSMNFDAPEWVLQGPSPITLTASTSTDLPLNFYVLSGPAMIDRNQLRVLGLGNISVRAEQPGNDQFLPVASRTFVIVVRPKLEIHSIPPTPLTIAWPRAAYGFVLEQSTNLTGGKWVTSPDLSADDSGNLLATPNTKPQTLFFRLRQY